jgi:hypothetical protein
VKARRLPIPAPKQDFASRFIFSRLEKINSLFAAFKTTQRWPRSTKVVLFSQWAQRHASDRP